LLLFYLSFFHISFSSINVSFFRIFSFSLFQYLSLSLVFLCVFVLSLSLLFIFVYVRFFFFWKVLNKRLFFSIMSGKKRGCQSNFEFLSFDQFLNLQEKILGNSFYFWNFLKKVFCLKILYYPANKLSMNQQF